MMEGCCSWSPWSLEDVTSLSLVSLIFLIKEALDIFLAVRAISDTADDPELELEQPELEVTPSRLFDLTTGLWW